MTLYPTILLVSTLISPIVAEVLTQSFVIRLKEMEQLIQDQKQVIEDQRKFIDSSKSGVHFTVGLSDHATFVNVSIIKFDKVITNVGGGYIGNVNNTDYGKFIAPGNGTYQFSTSFFNSNNSIGADLKKNGELVIVANNGDDGYAGLSAILDLTEGDEVYLLKPHWVGNDATFHRFITSFYGLLIV